MKHEKLIFSKLLPLHLLFHKPEEMNTKTEDLFKAWLKLDENEKRDFIKEVLNYNNLPEAKQKAIKKSYGQS